MHVTHLHLVDYRSYTEVQVALQPGVCVFVGANGQGKTNLIEAVEYLATLGSHRVAGDQPLVRAGAERATVRARVRASVDDPRSLLLELDIVPGKANRAKLNRAPLKRARDLLGALVVVLFSPEDLAVVKGDPSERRRFLDDLLVSRWPRFAGIRGDYDRVLRQRNALLKSLSGRTGRVAGADVAATLDTWDEHLSRLGAELIVARLATLLDLAAHLDVEYRAIAPVNNEARATYVSSNPVGVQPTALASLGLTRPSHDGSFPSPGAGSQAADGLGTPPGLGNLVLGEAADVAEPAFVPLTRDEIAEVLRARMSERRSEEIARGVSLVGPHRDDILLEIGTLPAKGYASHGESWSLACALRLAAFRLLRSDGIEPVLILDDVFAELDHTRRQRLALGIADAEQVLITAAVADDVPEELGGVRYFVDSGTVTPEDGSDA
ncbi:MAG: DNA replication/repair protein RecF [Propionibacteriaceae bacterium]